MHIRLNVARAKSNARGSRRQLALTNSPATEGKIATTDGYEGNLSEPHLHDTFGPAPVSGVGRIEFVRRVALYRVVIRALSRCRIRILVSRVPALTLHSRGERAEMRVATVRVLPSRFSRATLPGFITMEGPVMRRNTAASERLVSLGFKVPFEFRRKYKTYAAREGCTMNELLQRSFDALIARESSTKPSDVDREIVK